MTPFQRVRRDAPILQRDLGAISSGTAIIDVSSATEQKLTVGGDITIEFEGWPEIGYVDGIELELVNSGAHTITWPTIKWLKGDGTSSTTFSDMGVTLQSSGTNFFSIWSTDGGATLYGSAV